jgi:hypothetical protein
MKTPSDRQTARMHHGSDEARVSGARNGEAARVGPAAFHEPDGDSVLSLPGWRPVRQGQVGTDAMRPRTATMCSAQRCSSGRPHATEG